MASLQRTQNQSVASAGLMMTLVVAVWCASCGSTRNGGSDWSSDAGAGADGAAGVDEAGGCIGFTCSSGSSDAATGRFAGGDDSGAPVMSVAPVTGPVTDTNCPGVLSASQVSSLQSASSNSASVEWLYPYDATVFPGGLTSPILQWNQSGTPDGLYLHLHSQKYDFTGCYSGSNLLQLPIDEKEWATAYAQSGGKGDPLTVELSSITASTVSGPIKETWTFAKGNLAAVVYYNTYASHLVPGQVGENGAVMKIDPGATTPTAFLYTPKGSVFPFGPCVSCHSLSADGSTLVAQQHAYPGKDPLSGKGSMSFNLKTTPMPDTASPTASTLKDDWGFSAVYPDGSLILTSGEAVDTTKNPAFPAVAGDNPGMIGPKAATLYDAATGATVPYTGLTTPYAMMPMFSPDGQHIVYTEVPSADAGAGGHTLTVMDFDVGTKTFSNGRQVFQDDTKFPGWPFFTPDGKDVIFALGNANNFATEKSPPAAKPVSASELYVVAAAGGGVAQRLDRLSGYTNGTLYLPNGSKDEALDFYPTVNPVSSGGYFWVYFTSRRAYGNLYDKGSENSGSKSIWVAAIDIDAPPGTDPSHPAFYLPGQELGSGNIRAFAVLPVCKGDGASCESGIDCCGGSCVTGKCGVPQACAGEGNKCTPTIPCCNTQDQCLGGYCGFIAK